MHNTFVVNIKGLQQYQYQLIINCTGEIPKFNLVNQTNWRRFNLAYLTKRFVKMRKLTTAICHICKGILSWNATASYYVYLNIYVTVLLEFILYIILSFQITKFGCRCTVIVIVCYEGCETRGPELLIRKKGNVKK